jgi:hypothetical protein
VTLRKAIAAAATASLTLASACSTPPRAPDEGLKLRLELAANLLDVADVGMTLFATEVTKSYIAGEPGEVYLAKQMTRNTAVNNLRSLALGQDPTGALVDLYVWVRLAEQACANRNRSLPGLRDHPYDCHATYGELKRRIDGLMETGFNGKPVYSADLRAELDRIVVDFQSTHPDLVSAGLFRIDDLRDYSGSRMQVIAQAPEAMLSPVEDARAEIERARLVAAQMVWLASRLPTAAGWEAQSVVDELRQGNAGDARRGRCVGRRPLYLRPRARRAGGRGGERPRCAQGRTAACRGRRGRRARCADRPRGDHQPATGADRRECISGLETVVLIGQPARS